MDTAQIPDLLTPAVPFFIITVIIEFLVVRRLKNEGSPVMGHTVKDTAASLTMGLGNLFVNIFWKGVAFAFYTMLYELTPLRVGTGVVAWVLLFFADDFCYYWYHRAHHEVRLFWASHVVHHSSEHYNLSTALRQPWVTMTGLPFWAPMALLGFSPAQIVIGQSLSLLYQYWIHTEAIRWLGPLEWVLNTPSHHRVHHASNVQYLDKNYGGVLIIWDRLFGTFAPEEERPVYGITKKLNSFNPVWIAFHEFAAIYQDLKRSDSLRMSLSRIFRGPGWKPAEEQPPTMPSLPSPTGRGTG